MNEVIDRIADIGIVPVVTLESAASALPLGRALAAGGLPVAEITFRTAAAAEAIRALSAEEPGLLVGAGTVTTVTLVEEALAAGARFIVCPAWDEAVVDRCLERGVPVLPGVSGPDGVARCAAKGLVAVKFFPAEASGGVAMLDALSGPFGSMRFVPTGGIDSSNIGAYARRKQVLAVGGSWMVRAELVEAGDWAGIERLCREALLALHGFAIDHIGLNGPDREAASRDAATLAALFGLLATEAASSILVSGALELLGAPGLGERGQIAIRCNDVERARARLRGMGVGVLAGTELCEGGRLASVCLDLSIRGFAIRLLRA